MAWGHRQTIRCLYQGRKIVITVHWTRIWDKVHVSVLRRNASDKWTEFYGTETRNIHSAIAYAFNAAHYDVHGAMEWPAGYPDRNLDPPRLRRTAFPPNRTAYPPLHPMRIN